MRSRNALSSLLFAPLAIFIVACGGDEGDRSALQEDELSRDLELALQGDTMPATFEDTSMIRVDTAARPSQQPVERPATQQPAPQPQPQRPEPRPQQPAPQPQPRPERPRTVTSTVPSGTAMAIRLNQTLSTETSSVGDGFTARLLEPVIGSDGRTIIPAGATVRGRVTAVKASSRVGETALIKVAFESISFDGESHRLDATVVDANPERRTRTSRGEQAAKIGAATAAGAIIGQVLGKDREATIAGAAIGAAAGTAIAMGTSDVDAVLSQGSRMVIRLDRPIEITRRG